MCRKLKLVQHGPLYKIGDMCVWLRPYPKALYDYGKESTFKTDEFSHTEKCCFNVRTDR